MLAYFINGRSTSVNYQSQMNVVANKTASLLQCHVKFKHCVCLNSPLQMEETENDTGKRPSLRGVQTFGIFIALFTLVSTHHVCLATPPSRRGNRFVYMNQLVENKCKSYSANYGIPDEVSVKCIYITSYAGVRIYS